MVFLGTDGEGLKQSITILTIYLAMTAMAFFNVASDLAMFAASVLLLTTSVIDRDAFLKGYGNSSVVCVGLLLVVAKGVEETGALERLVKAFLGKPATRSGAQLAMMVPVLLISAFLSNTACVAMMIPIIQSWSDAINQSRSQLLLPLSYVSMMGGCLSLIGSSNNLVAYEAAKQEDDSIEIGMFDVALAGVPMTICGIIYMVFASPRLLPDDRKIDDAEHRYGRSSFTATTTDTRYSMCFWVTASKTGNPNDVLGRTPAQISFNRPGLTFVSRHRHTDDDGNDLGPNEPFTEGELLIFKGTGGRLCKLQKVPGLILATKEIEKLSFGRTKFKSDNKLSKRRHRRIVEAVIDVSSPLVGKTVKEVSFRQSYNAVIIARRHGLLSSSAARRHSYEETRRSTSKECHDHCMTTALEEGASSCSPGKTAKYVSICTSTDCDCNTSWGEVKFGAGDSLLMVASSSFVKQNSPSRAFALATELADSKPPRNDNTKDLMRSMVTWIMLLAIIGVSAYDDTYLLEMCVITVTLQIYFSIMTMEEAWSAVKGSTLLTIASSFSLGEAIQRSGLADIIANGIGNIAEPFGQIGLLGVVYFVTSFLSIMVSNTAVVVFMFEPVARAAANAHMELLPFVFILMIASSAAYATPISYQTNLMVYGPGGYTFNDYLRFGGPLQIVSWVSTTIMVYLIWVN